VISLKSLLHLKGFPDVFNLHCHISRADNMKGKVWLRARAAPCPQRQLSPVHSALCIDNRELLLGSVLVPRSCNDVYGAVRTGKDRRAHTPSTRRNTVGACVAEFTILLPQKVRLESAGLSWKSSVGPNLRFRLLFSDSCSCPPWSKH
jgi:hypothetical protein